MARVQRLEWRQILMIYIRIFKIDIYDQQNVLCVIKY